MSYCRKGHSQVGGNVLKLKSGRRRCRICANDGYNRRYREKTRVSRAMRETANEMLQELKNVVYQAECNPFLAIGMLIEHHSKIRQVIAKAEGRDE